MGFIRRAAVLITAAGISLAPLVSAMATASASSAMRAAPTAALTCQVTATSVIGGWRNKVIATLTGFSGPFAVAADRISNTVYVTNQNGTVTALVCKRG